MSAPVAASELDVAVRFAVDAENPAAENPAPSGRPMVGGACVLCSCVSARRWYRIDEEAEEPGDALSAGAAPIRAPSATPTYVAGLGTSRERRLPLVLAPVRSTWAGAGARPTERRAAVPALPRPERAAVVRERLERVHGVQRAGVRAGHHAQLRQDNGHPAPPRSSGARAPPPLGRGAGRERKRTEVSVWCRVVRTKARRIEEPRRRTSSIVSRDRRRVTRVTRFSARPSRRRAPRRATPACARSWRRRLAWASAAGAAGRTTGCCGSLAAR